jgi:hypothetical protein
MRLVSYTAGAFLIVGLAVGCGGAPATGGNDAATAAARIKGGLEAQAGAVQAVSTAAASAVAGAGGPAGLQSTAVAASTQAATVIAGAGGPAGIQATAVAGATQAATVVAGAGGTAGIQATVLAGATQAAASLPPGAASTAQAAVGTAQAAAGGPAGLSATAQAAANAAVKGAGGMTPDQIGQQARGVAAQALGVPPDQVTVDRVESVDWNDSSLGCREANKVYAQVVTPGFRAVLSGGGKKVEVHADSSGRMVTCQNPTQ